jgi:DNA-binding MarR family transcriptional regulator
MSLENMSPDKVSSLSYHGEPSAYRSDADGFLFDPAIREILVRTGRKVSPGIEALAAVRMLGKKMHATMERWAEQHGLSEGRFQILVRLQHQSDGRLAMGELAELLDVSPRTVTGLVDNLERDGFVKRVDAPDDRRSVFAEITEQGRNAVKRLWRDSEGGQAALIKGFSEAELIQLRHLSLRLMQAMAAAELVGAGEGEKHASR